MLLGKRRQIEIIPGVNPLADSTELDTILFTDSDKIRFQNGKLRKMLGWQRIFPTDYLEIQGAARSIYSYSDFYNNPVTLIGTSYGLYAYYPEQGDYFYNITPLQTTTNAIPNSLSTEYNTANVTVDTVLNSSVVTLHLNQYFINNQYIKISGVAGGPYNGIPASDFNGSFAVNVLNNQLIQITLATPATSTGTVTINMTWASDYVYVNFPDSGSQIGDRVKITGATSVDGLTTGDINAEFTITNIVDENNFVIDTGVVATSSVTGGGGAGVLIQLQLPPGSSMENFGYGYGAGQFGKGPFGKDQPKGNNIITEPRIWSMADFNTGVILTPGDPPTTSTDNIYIWQNSLKVAPVLASSLAGADSVPLAVKWVYFSNVSAIALGSGGNLNQFNSSDAVSVVNPLPVNWAPGPTTEALQFVVADATALLSQSKSRNFDLLFTSSEVYQVEYVQKPDIWFFRKLFSTDGIIGPKARGIVEDAVIWMGTGDFYVFDGYTVNVLPNNTVKRYVYDNINWGQTYKFFCFVDIEWSTIRFYYCAGTDTEPNNYVDYNWKEGHWTIGTNARSAAEEPVNAQVNPILAQSFLVQNIPIPDGISTYFITLGTNPLSVTNSSNIVSTTLTAVCTFQIGDMISIAGSTDVGGILAANINGTRTIASADSSGNITFTAGAAATSTTTGGGSSITVGTQILSITYTGNDIGVGETITISNASAVDGFSASQINISTPVTVITGYLIQFNVASGFSTSSATGGGVTATLILNEGVGVFSHNDGLNDYNIDFNVKTDPWDSQFIPLNSYALTNYSQIGEGDETMLIYSTYSDISQQGNMEITVNVREYAQSPYTSSQVFTLTPETTNINPMLIGRERQYIFQSNVLNGNYLMGKLYEELKRSTPR